MSRPCDVALRYTAFGQDLPEDQSLHREYEGVIRSLSVSDLLRTAMVYVGIIQGSRLRAGSFFHPI